MIDDLLKNRINQCLIIIKQSNTFQRQAYGTYAVELNHLKQKYDEKCGAVTSYMTF